MTTTLSGKKYAAVRGQFRKEGWICRLVLPVTAKFTLEVSKKIRLNHVECVRQMSLENKKFKAGFYFSPGKKILDVTGVSKHGFRGIFFPQISRGGVLFNLRSNFLFVHYLYGNQREKITLLCELRETFPDHHIVAYIFRETSFVRKLLRKGFLRKSESYQDYLLLSPLVPADDAGMPSVPSG